LRKPANANPIAVNAALMKVERAPDDIIGKRRHDFKAFQGVATRSRELALGCDGACVLEAAHTHVCRANRQSNERWPGPLPRQGPDESCQQDQRERRVND
jgi:hypothetical protein